MGKGRGGRQRNKPTKNQRLATTTTTLRCLAMTSPAQFDNCRNTGGRGKPIHPSGQRPCVYKEAEAESAYP